MKTPCISGHRGLKMLSFYSPNETPAYACACLSCCCCSFEKQQKRHVQVMAFPSFDWQHVWHMGSLVTMVTGSRTWLLANSPVMLMLKNLKKQNKQKNPPWWKYLTALLYRWHFVTINKMYINKYFGVSKPSRKECFLFSSPVSWNAQLPLLEKYTKKRGKKSLWVIVKNPNQSLLTLHQLLSLPPSSLHCLWCEAGDP